MIGQLFGKITLVNNIEGSICVLVQSGVGYTVSVGTNFALNLKCEDVVNLFIETVVKEDSITLYGFESYEKQMWFKSFLKVSGVGTKMAMNIIDTFAIESIILAIVNQNALFFQSVSGLGEKVSQRIISELKKEPAKNTKIYGGVKSSKNSTQIQEIPQIQTQKTAESSKKTPQKQETSPKININDVISALVNLGFDYNKAYNAAKNAIEHETTLENAIVFALKKIND